MNERASGKRRAARPRGRHGAGLFDEILVDNFAGGGGASLGIEMALGRSVDVAINHDAEAVALHAANHPATRHHCEDVFKVDPVEATGGRPVGLAWFSPDCKHHSRAKGGKPVSRKIRGLAWVVIRWAARVQPRVIMLENVREFADWGPLNTVMKCACGWSGPPAEMPSNPSGVRTCPRCGGSGGLVKASFPCPKRKGQTFRRWLAQLRNKGYEVQHRNLDAADFGAPTHRRRLFLIARRDGMPIRWPEPTHGPGRPKPYRTAASCIDFGVPCPSIFLTRAEGRAVGANRPLAEKTLRRIAMGLKRFVLDNPKPFVVRVNHGGDHFRGQPVGQPLATLTGRHGYGLATPYFTAQNGERAGQDPRASRADEPVNVITPREGGGHPLVVPHITKFFGGVVGQETTEPLPTITATDHNGLVAANLVRYYGDATEAHDENRAVDRPLGTIVSSDKHALATASLIQYNGEKGGETRGVDVAGPINTVTGENRFGVVSAFLSTHYGDRPDGSAQVGHPVAKPAPTATGRSTQQSLAAANLIKMNFGDKQAMAADEPLRTILAGANHHGLAVSHLTKFNSDGPGSRADGPSPTQTGRSHLGEVRAFLCKYYGAGGDGQAVDGPLHTVTANDRFGLVTVGGRDYLIADIGLRMLRPRELYRCQGFPDSYRIDVTTRDGRKLPKSAQVRMVGNSVCPDIAAALVRANMAEIAAWPTIESEVVA